MTDGTPEKDEHVDRLRRLFRSVTSARQRRMLRDAMRSVMRREDD